MTRVRVVAAAFGLASLVALAGALPPQAVPSVAASTFAAPGTPGDVATVPDWRMASSATEQDDGATISDPDFADGAWLSVPRRSTVMAGLIANGRYPDLNFSTNLRDHVDPADFTVPWWYRRTFTAPTASDGTHTLLRLDGGVISRGEVWLNGARLATTDDVVGAYPRHEFDVTGLLRPGANALAIKAMPADPFRDFTISFLDWSPLAPDNNQGVWRDVKLATVGAVSMDAPRVLTALALPGLHQADLTVKVDLRNHTDEPVTATVKARIERAEIVQDVTLAAHESRAVTFAPVRIENPRVWWPAQFGGQPLYRLDLTATASESLADKASTSFGIRDVRSELTPQGYRKFYVNGKPFGVRGGGWASDLYLRTDPARLEDELRIARDLGLNTLRMEGKNEDAEFLAIADRLGLMLLPGWECCTKWEKYSAWTDADYRTAYESTKAEAQRMVNHPSVLGFFIGSDNAATARVEQTYLDAMRAADFTAPILPSAAAKTTPQLGKSGMKMDGPYWWIPPAYWYQDQLGGSDGFASEVGPGPSISELDSLRRFLTDAEIDDLWRKPDQAHYHLAKKEVFSKLSLFSQALAKRYGAPTSLDDFLRKAQLANYEVSRAQLEAYGRDFSDPVNPATGVIYWMANNAWPTQYFNLWDHNLATAGTYFGAKAALRPLHVQYSYDDRSVVLVNTGLTTVNGLTVRATTFALDGSVLADQTLPADAKPNAASRLGVVEAPSSAPGGYLVRLLLRDADGKELDRNVYWLSTSADVMDFPRSTWWNTPVTSFADLTGLQDLPTAKVTSKVATRPAGRSELTTEVTLTNTSGTVAVMVRASVRLGTNGPEVLPVHWSDNYVTLWPGESVVLRGTYDRADLADKAPRVEVSGFNLP